MGILASKASLVPLATTPASNTHDDLKKRLETSPGLPVQKSTLPLWTVPPVAIPHDSLDTLPDYADIVVIGSGITGTSFAYNAYARHNDLKIVMLEARYVCSGATGRNGGHINPPLYRDYRELKQRYGKDAAQAIIKFRLSHLKELQSIASREDILKESHCCETEHLDLYTTTKSFEAAKKSLARWRAEMPSAVSRCTSYERQDAIETYNLSEQVVGCISNSGGAMYSYRFVTSLLSILLARHPKRFPHTPCTAISSPSPKDPHQHLYTVHTPRGIIRTPHIVHATNGWSSHLLPPLRTKIVPARGAMSAPRSVATLPRPTLDDKHSFVFYRGAAGYDYLTQLPTGEREMTFGGGWHVVFKDKDGGDGADVPDIGVVDDSRVGHAAQSYLAGALPQFSGIPDGDTDAGASAKVADDYKFTFDSDEWGTGKTKAQWSGIVGISADGLPWVGRLPAKVCGRIPPKVVRHGQAGADHEAKKDGDDKETRAKTAAPGEWIAAGYSGEGMVHAWMSGKALACMVLDREREERLGEWFPEVLRVTEKRWSEANVDRLVARFL